MPKHLQNDLEHLHRALLRLAGYVEDAVITATSALRLRDPEPAQSVIDGDNEIDSLENEVQGIVLTGELAKYGNILLTKGVTPSP